MLQEKSIAVFKTPERPVRKSVLIMSLMTASTRRRSTTIVNMSMGASSLLGAEAVLT
ncbi:hypothetical protein [Enterovirga rhinocerotis]|uniref:hypothetical protein n=1 Tax=Enterovirga rhinocerotis TaxID=1339210 RepID=UPI003CCB5746